MFGIAERAVKYRDFIVSNLRPYVSSAKSSLITETPIMIAIDIILTSIFIISSILIVIVATIYIGFYSITYCNSNEARK